MTPGKDLGMSTSEYISAGELIQENDQWPEKTESSCEILQKKNNKEFQTIPPPPLLYSHR